MTLESRLDKCNCTTNSRFDCRERDPSGVNLNEGELQRCRHCHKTLKCFCGAALVVVFLKDSDRSYCETCNRELPNLPPVIEERKPTIVPLPIKPPAVRIKDKLKTPIIIKWERSYWWLVLLVMGGVLLGFIFYQNKLAVKKDQDVKVLCDMALEKEATYEEIKEYLILAKEKIIDFELLECLSQYVSTKEKEFSSCLAAQDFEGAIYAMEECFRISNCLFDARRSGQHLIFLGDLCKKNKGDDCARYYLQAVKKMEKIEDDLGLLKSARATLQDLELK